MPQINASKINGTVTNETMGTAQRLAGSEVNVRPRNSAACIGTNSNVMPS